MQVNYNAADPFPPESLGTCRCSALVGKRELKSQNDTSRKRGSRNRLSAEGRGAAIEYGKSELRISILRKERMNDRASSYIDDQSVTVLYVEDGEIYEVVVTRADL